MIDCYRRWLAAISLTLISVILMCCCWCYCQWKCRRRQRNNSSSSRTHNSSVRNPTANPIATQTARTVATTPATNGTVGMIETTSCTTPSPCRKSDSGSYNLEPALYSHGDAPPSYYELDLYS